MSLIKCPECGKEISDKAIMCPSCGNPIQPTNVKTEENFNVEIKQTNKKWKKLHLLAIIFFFFGIVAGVSGKFWSFGILSLFISVIIEMISRVGGWWTNG